MFNLCTLLPQDAVVDADALDAKVLINAAISDNGDGRKMCR